MLSAPQTGKHSHVIPMRQQSNRMKVGLLDMLLPSKSSSLKSNRQNFNGDLTCKLLCQMSIVLCWKMCDMLLDHQVRHIWETSFLIQFRHPIHLQKILYHIIKFKEYIETRRAFSATQTKSSVLTRLWHSFFSAQLLTECRHEIRNIYSEYYYYPFSLSKLRNITQFRQQLKRSGNIRT